MIQKLINEKLENFIARAFIPDDYEQLFLLHKNNERYYSLFSLDAVDKAQVLSGLEQLPPNTVKSQKHYIGIYDKAELSACLDFVEKYPDKDTIYIGLLMVDVNYKKRGLGSLVVNALAESGRDSGYTKIRLACLEANTEGYSFWQKCGFLEVERKTTKEYGNEEKLLIIMEKMLA